MISLFLLQMLMEELEPEERFLQYARNGDLLGIQRLLVSKIKEETQININCKGRRGSFTAQISPECCVRREQLVTVWKSSGKKKSNLGWTPLHLACYFGHKDVVAELLKVRLLFEAFASVFEELSRVYVRCNAPQAGADANLPNNIGDTALHKAAFTGRKARSLFQIFSSCLLCFRVFFVPLIRRINHSTTYWSGGCHAAAALWRMCHDHQWDRTDSQGRHSEPRDQNHAGRWALHVKTFIRWPVVMSVCLCSHSPGVLTWKSVLWLFWTPAAERTEERKQEEELLEAAREGDLSTLSQLVSVPEHNVFNN